MNNENKDTLSVEEEKIVESYNSFLGQIDTSNLKKKKIQNKWMFIIAIIIGLYGWITIAVEDIRLTFEFFDTFISTILSFFAGSLAFVLFITAWKRKSILENDCENDYKSILEANLNIEIDNAYQSDEDFEKLSKEEYVNAGFKYAEEKHGYLYMSLQKILIHKNIEAYLVEIDKCTGDTPDYIIDGYVTKQKIDNNKNYTLKDVSKIVSEFNKQYGCNIKNNIEVSLYNGYLYILFNKLDLYFEYSKLIEYKEYKKLYSNISLIAELSEFIYDNINHFS